MYDLHTMATGKTGINWVKIDEVQNIYLSTLGDETRDRDLKVRDKISLTLDKMIYQWRLSR